ncbi:MAG: hypothetical protein ACI9V1_000962 [Spirosomataceae bacterium]|jgi:hypothetical protein
MYNLKNNTKLSDALYTLLCVVRLFVCLPLIIFIGIIYLPIMTLLGVRYAGDSSIKLFEKFVFNHSDD